jgi:demethylmenaquinone methyltransferase / 2-methoxy-6-polyprenyl-1,4-benzoquinol methylase
VTDPKAWYVSNLFSRVPREYDTLLALLTFGQDHYWRDFVVAKSTPTRDGLILDVATGPGTLAAEFSQRISDGGLVVGVDLTRSMLQTAKTNMRGRNLGNRTDWVQARAENLPFKNECFDTSAISLALRNVSDAKKTLGEMARTTIPGGVVVSLDFARPTNKLFKLVYYDYLLGLFPVIGRIVSDAWGKTLSYLGRSILRARTGEQIANLMVGEGLVNARSVPLTMGVVCAVYGTKR